MAGGCFGNTPMRSVWISNFSFSDIEADYSNPRS
jgi:hypothetical protein